MVSSHSHWHVAAGRIIISRTFIELYICDGLPFIHCNKPSSIMFATAEINNQFRLVVSESYIDCLKLGHRKLALWEEK